MVQFPSCVLLEDPPVEPAHHTTVHLSALLVAAFSSLPTIFQVFHLSCQPSCFYFRTLISTSISRCRALKVAHIFLQLLLGIHIFPSLASSLRCILGCLLICCCHAHLFLFIFLLPNLNSLPQFVEGLLGQLICLHVGMVS